MNQEILHKPVMIDGNPEKWLQMQRRRVMETLLGIIVVIGLPAIIYSAIRIISLRTLTFNTTYYLIAYSILFIILVFRQIGDRVRSIIMMGVFYSFALLATYSGWLAGSGRLFMLMLIPVASVILSNRASIATAVASFITYIVFGILFYYHLIPFPVLGDFLSPVVMLIEGIGFSIALGIAAASQLYWREASKACAQANNDAILARLEAEEAWKKADEANTLKSQFLASMSHELRTPLNAIINFSQFVSSGLKGPINAAQEDSLNKVTSSARHLLQLINDVLDISKIEANSLQLYIEDDFNIEKLLHEIREIAEVLVENKEVAVVLDIPSPLRPIRGDTKRIKQILLNLVSNATKFTEKGAVTLQAEILKDQLHITVSDTGPGIPDEDREAIFETFRQTETGLKVGKGTGLGLPISKKLAEAHGGSLNYVSELNKGTSFTLILPVHGVSLEEA